MSEQVLINIIVVILSLIALSWIIIKINSTKCPSCKKLWTKSVLKRELIHKEPFYKTVTRYDIKKDSSGKEIGRTERKEQIHMIRFTTQVFCSCKKCNYTWNYIEKREEEG